jgi:hypothetical protein
LAEETTSTWISEYAGGACGASGVYMSWRRRRAAALSLRSNLLRARDEF